MFLKSNSSSISWLAKKRLDALDRIDQRSVRSHVPQNSVLQFHQWAEHPPCVVVHHSRGAVVRTGVVGHMHSDSETCDVAA